MGRVARAVAVAVATLALMLATDPRLAIVWDEGYTLGREARVRAWFAGPARPGAVRRDLAAPGRRARPAGRGPPPPAPTEIDTRAELLRPARPRLVLAVRPRGAARPPALLRARRA